MKPTFHDHFSGVADRYADFRPHYPAALFDYLATVAPRQTLVWDCACGNGQASIDLASRFDRVIGTDASQEQIASAKPLPNVEFRVAPAEQSGLPDGSVGLVTVAQALHWFNFDRFYAEVRRVVAPGGVLAVWAYAMNTLEGEAADQIIQEFYANQVGPYWPPECNWVEAGYRTIPFPFTDLNPPPFQMEARWTLEQLLGYFSTWSATTRFIKATGQDPIKPLTEALGKVWGDPRTPRLVVWRMALRVGRT
jgi:SAM-dependent methyltransferase